MVSGGIKHGRFVSNCFMFFFMHCRFQSVMDETSDKAHISRSPPTIRAKKVKLMRSLSSGDNVPNRCQPDSVADNFTPLLPACLNVEPTSTTTSEPNDPLNAINDQTNYGATFTTTAEVEANCESPSKNVPKVGITDATTDFSTTDERPGTSSGDTGAHSFKTFSASWFHFPSRSSAAQGSSSHRRAQSIGTDLKYDNSTENINSGWKCFPEVRKLNFSSWTIFSKRKLTLQNLSSQNCFSSELLSEKAK